MEKATRILVANTPKLMREVILATLAGQPGIEIVGEVAEEAEILDQVRAKLPDLLVVALDENEQRPAICDRVLRVHPDLRIIAVASRKDRTLYFWASFDIHCADIESSTAGILNAVHDTAFRETAVMKIPGLNGAAAL
jgi:DNA-binding NarL/FixJ family response regulator